ncbi:MAG: Recombination protein RecR [Alphaproteobacteria bacterium UBA4588]|jgi:recombination protein RecR|nr:recombination mediator RecR [Alphaproteobacteria bacterium]CAI8376525.1 MAG: Recombination protein RecR [Alphaproteobacteria bacterium UBA4588]
MTDNPLESLIKRLSRLPGLGPRSARRAALHLLKNKETTMLPLAEELDHVARTIKTCVECGNLDLTDKCRICYDSRRDATRICVVEDVADLWAMERAGIFSGVYHVLGGTLSALDGRGPKELGIERLVARAANIEEGEVILATSATVDGQTTAHYIGERLERDGMAITRLAHGVPVGGELNYLDDGTLTQAMKARRPL